MGEMRAWWLGQGAGVAREAGEHDGPNARGGGAEQGTAAMGGGADCTLITDRMGAATLGQSQR